MIRLDENMEKSLRNFIETIAQTEIYQNYAIQKELLQKMEEFEMNYALLCANPLVDRYLSAELALARMYQEIQKEIHERLGLH